MIADVLLKKARDIAISRSIRFADENMSHGPSALKHIDRDIRNLALDIYEYQSSFEQARIAMAARRITEADYIITCDKVLPASEISGLNKLIDEVRKLADVSADLERRARARVHSQIRTAERLLMEKQKTLARMEKFNATRRDRIVVADTMRSLSRNLAHFTNSDRVLNRYGDDLDQLCAELVGILADIRDKLMRHSAGFAYFAKECFVWKYPERAQPWR